MEQQHLRKLSFNTKVAVNIYALETYKTGNDLTMKMISSQSKQTLIFNETTCPAAETPLSVLAALWKPI